MKIFLTLGFFSLFLFGQTQIKVKEINFSSQDLSFSQAFVEAIGQFYDVLLLSGCEVTDEVGKPQLPVLPLTISLPPNSQLSKVRVLPLVGETLSGRYLILPAQPQSILSQKRVKDFVFPVDEVYRSTLFYPGRIFDLKGCGVFFSAEKEAEKDCLVEFLIYPVQYQPRDGKVVFYKKLRLELDYDEDARSKAQSPKRSFSFSILSQYFEYLIITSPPLDTVFGRLANWKTKKGVPAVIRTVSWIEANYPGRDRPEKIRNYLRALPDSGLKWVLLGGDVDIIPCRYAYAMTCSANFHPREDRLPCDLYYSDLDGNWNFDGDTIFGEVEDSVDLYPDLFVGRAPVNTISEAQAFVNKVLTYEKSPPADYLQDALFFAEVLWHDPYTDGGKHKDMIEREAFSSNFNITKLYESRGNETREAVMAEMRRGKNLLNHDGHGWIDVMSTGIGALSNQDMDTITNQGKFGILYSIGCWTQAFDYDCIAEHYLLNPRGGGIAFIGNSSYGWGSPGNPGFGYSDKFDTRFFYELLKKDRRLGEALSYAKMHYIPFSRSRNVYRWHQYQLNLLGDPELTPWTNKPDSLTVYSPMSIPQGESRILVSVSYQGRPVKDALVCLMKEGSSYDRGNTSERGEVFLQARTDDLGDFSLTVTAKNFYPCERQIPVVRGGYVNFTGFFLNDSLGNSDKIPNPGETVFLSCGFKNCGSEPVANINLSLTSSDSLIIITDSVAFLGYLGPGESLFIKNGFQLTIGDAPNGHCSYLNLVVKADSERIYKPTLLIGTPLLSIHHPQVKDKPSLPGQEKKINISLANSGLGIGHNTWASLSSLDPYITVFSPESLFYGEITPKSVKQIPNTFLISISPFCPGSYLGKLQLTIRCASGTFFDTFSLLIGQAGMADDMERGDSLWQTGGSGNLWHISSRRAHSGNYSWYCGERGTGRYNDNMNCWVQTIPFMVEENSYLKFWRWFKLPIYGVDGVYVIILKRDRACTLDFIGTGGALGEGKQIESDWCQESYNLAFLPAGETIQVRFAFKSDNDGRVGEGFYLDDVEVVQRLPEVPNFVAKKSQPIPSFKIRVFPNPFSSKLFIHWINPQEALSPCIYQIYDVKGSLIKNLIAKESGSIFWNRRDEKGRKVSSGLYFLFLKTKGNSYPIAKVKAFE